MHSPLQHPLFLQADYNYYGISDAYTIHGDTDGFNSMPVDDSVMLEAAQFIPRDPLLIDWESLLRLPLGRWLTSALHPQQTTNHSAAPMRPYHLIRRISQTLPGLLAIFLQFNNSSGTATNAQTTAADDETQSADEYAHDPAVQDHYRRFLDDLFDDPTASKRQRWFQLAMTRLPPLFLLHTAQRLLRTPTPLAFVDLAINPTLLLTHSWPVVLENVELLRIQLTLLSFFVTTAHSLVVRRHQQAASHLRQQQQQQQQIQLKRLGSVESIVGSISSTGSSPMTSTQLADRNADVCYLLLETAVIQMLLSRKWDALKGDGEEYPLLISEYINYRLRNDERLAKLLLFQTFPLSGSNSIGFHLALRDAFMENLGELIQQKTSPENCLFLCQLGAMIVHQYRGERELQMAQQKLVPIMNSLLQTAGTALSIAILHDLIDPLERLCLTFPRDLGASTLALMLEIKQVAKRRESSSEVERFMQRLKKAALHCKAIVDFPTDSRINTSR